MWNLPINQVSYSPGHARRLVEDGFLVDVDVGGDEVVRRVAADAVATALAPIVLILHGNFTLIMVRSQSAKTKYFAIKGPNADGMDWKLHSVMESDPIVYARIGGMIISVNYPSIRIWNYDRML